MNRVNAACLLILAGQYEAADTEPGELLPLVSRVRVVYTVGLIRELLVMIRIARERFDEADVLRSEPQEAMDTIRSENNSLHGAISGAREDLFVP